jgi:hypothetical protein
MHLEEKSQQGSWQETCSKGLLAAAQEEQNSPGAGRAKWLEMKKAFRQKSRVVLADLNLDGACLRGFDFSYCYIIRCSFKGCDLRDAVFRYCIIKQCSVTRSDISGANFADADTTSTNFYGVKWNEKTKLNWASEVHDGNSARPLFRQAVEEQRYIDDLRRAKHRLALKIWNFSTKYGTSITRLFVVSVGLNVLFSVVYAVIAKFAPSSFKPAQPYAWSDTLILSLQRFLNSSASIDASDFWVSLLLLLNTSIGLAVLGIFVALLSKKLIASVR